jgi:Tol biopolymer transport system component
VSIASNGAQADAMCRRTSISDDGRFVAFQSSATNLVAADTNFIEDVFVRDLQTGITRRMSLSSSGEQANMTCFDPRISGDGRWIVFASVATNLDPGDTNTDWDIFVRDRQAGTTELVSVSSTGVLGNGSSWTPSISYDGRYVAFASTATNLAADEVNGTAADIFVRDRQAGTTERVSVATGGISGNYDSALPSISADGRYVAFASWATDLVSGDLNSEWDVFVHDRASGTTEMVSVDSAGAQGNDFSDHPSISADGRWVAFDSAATNLVPDDTNNDSDLFVHDLQSGTTERVCLNSGEGQADNPSFCGSISADGRYVTFWSLATNLVPGDTNSKWDPFLRDRELGTTERLSLDSNGAQGSGDHPESPGVPFHAGVTPDGRWVAFASWSTNLVSGDTNAVPDIFLRDRETAAFASLCDPGLPGYATCPCTNPPAGPTRGCDNSSATGGAVLTASGATHLSADSLVFTTSGEKPTALSIVLQGNAFVAGGLVYGQGIRCASGSLKRLYSKSAFGGSITAPEFGAGDLSVSAQSAAKGDTILPAQPRWYVVYYRDPIVLGGCPSSSTFNATQTGQVSWSP